MYLTFAITFVLFAAFKITTMKLITKEQSVISTWITDVRVVCWFVSLVFGSASLANMII